MNEVFLEKLYGVLKTYELEQIHQKEIYEKGRVVSASTALVVEVPQKVEEKIVQYSGLNQETMSSKSVPEVHVKVVLTTEAISDTDKVEQKDNMHNMPKIDCELYVLCFQCHVCLF